MFFKSRVPWCSSSVSRSFNRGSYGSSISDRYFESRSFSFTNLFTSGIPAGWTTANSMFSRSFSKAYLSSRNNIDIE